jgi:hypothetical protein
MMGPPVKEDFKGHLFSKFKFLYYLKAGYNEGVILL